VEGVKDVLVALYVFSMFITELCKVYVVFIGVYLSLVVKQFSILLGTYFKCPLCQIFLISDSFVKCEGGFLRTPE